MKRINSIQIENFRAFFGSYAPILLNNGENLLLYGENGSGKSSLFKALDHYFQSSDDPGFVFEVNSYAILPVNASIGIGFVDVDADQIPIAGTEHSYAFTNTVSNNNVAFIKDSNLIKGFLDYRSLLSIYFGSELNLFDLVVNEIIHNHIPGGETVSIGEQLSDIKEVLNRTDRRFNEHWDALDELTHFETMLRVYLDRLFLRLNRILIDYFKFNLRVWYQLQPLDFNHDTWVWDAKCCTFALFSF